MIMIRLVLMVRFDFSPQRCRGKKIQLTYSHVRSVNLNPASADSTCLPNFFSFIARGVEDLVRNSDEPNQESKL